MANFERDWAYNLAGGLLAESLPRRWAHTQGVAACARRLGPLLKGERAAVLEAAAVLHDIGYAPPLVDTGFHPLDGARHLRDVQFAPESVVRLVANHSFALLEAEERGLRSELAGEFPLLGDPLLVDALVYCDMTTTPDGGRTTSEERVGEILGRYGEDSVVGRFIRRAAPAIHGSVERVRAAAVEADVVL
ncbi:HD domain-containing protein [Streptomyces sp. CB03238]|uniref:HD domain-containing protein n=1 Tax=Streptomyces sp. CB03238 TaxID=1907777 RepID=UPI000A0FFC94|nr:HD domain-containing protein [Streptomyces sp. CB03238]ORT57953.1 phosphohydrolase [Streptomyces sp. CB03238]